MNEYAKKSILEMARGGFLEVTDLEMTKAIANIMDPNTSATAKRKITVTIELKADDSRQNIGVSYTVKSALAPTNAVTTMLYVADEENVVEMVPQIPGQFGIAGTEQEAPPALKPALSYFPGGRAAGEHLPDSRQRPWYQLHRG